VLPFTDIARQVAAMGGKGAGNDRTPPAVAGWGLDKFIWHFRLTDNLTRCLWKSNDDTLASRIGRSGWGVEWVLRKKTNRIGL